MTPSELAFRISNQNNLLTLYICMYYESAKDDDSNGEPIINVSLLINIIIHFIYYIYCLVFQKISYVLGLI